MHPSDIAASEARRLAERQAREVEELIALHYRYSPRTSGIDPYHRSRGITGQPSDPNRVVRASRNSWDRGMRGKTWGIATQDGNVLSAERGSVSVTRNGITTTETFRATRNRRARTLDVDTINAIDDQRHTTAADLEAIGNVE